MSKVDPSSPLSEPISSTETRVGGRPSRSLTLLGMMEVVLAAAAAFAIMHDGWDTLVEILDSQKPSRNLAVSYACDMAIVGVTIVGFLGLSWETLRGRGPTQWGWGRWTWNFVGFYVIAIGIDFFITVTPTNVRAWFSQGVKPPVLLHAFIRHFVNYLLVSGRGGLAFDVALLTIWWSGKWRDPSPDAREWAGRVFALSILASTIVVRIMTLAGW